MLKIKITVLLLFVFTALLCFTACTLGQAPIEQNKDIVTNDISKVQDEQESNNIETPSKDMQENSVAPEIEPEVLPDGQKEDQELDTKIFFGEEYVKREDIGVPKHVLKNIPTGQVKKQEYKLVTPTQEEFDEIVERLRPILSMFLFDYDWKKDNIYEFLFHYDHLDYVYPEYDNQVAEYIAKPLAINTENNFWFWDIYRIYSKDPLNKFSIPDEVYDEDGNVNFDRVEELYSDGNHVAIGHNMFSGAYIDWLVEGVWNSKADHDTFFEFEDGTLLYYYDGNYYTPELCRGRGGGIMFSPYIHEITALGDNKYKMVYYKNDGYGYGDDRVYNKWYETIIGLKETQDGFRFWSIFEFRYTGAEWSE